MAYARSNTAVSVNLATGAGSGGHAQGDTLSNIEAVVASAHDDTLIGGDESDRLVGQGGADSLDGGGGVDEVSYFTSSAAVSVNLATGAVSGGHAQGDTISGFEDVWGSAHDDTLAGDRGANELNGGAGSDTLTGGAGADIFRFDAYQTNRADRDVVTDYAEGDLVQLNMRGVLHTTAAEYGGFTLDGGVLTGHGFHITLQGPGVGSLELDDVAVV